MAKAFLVKRNVKVQYDIVKRGSFYTTFNYMPKNITPKSVHGKMTYEYDEEEVMKAILERYPSLQPLKCPDEWYAIRMDDKILPSRGSKR